MKYAKFIRSDLRLIPGSKKSGSHQDRCSPESDQALIQILSGLVWFWVMIGDESWLQFLHNTIWIQSARKAKKSSHKIHLFLERSVHLAFIRFGIDQPRGFYRHVWEEIAFFHAYFQQYEWPRSLYSVNCPKNAQSCSSNDIITSCRLNPSPSC